MLKACRGSIDHIESRRHQQDVDKSELFLAVEISPSGLLHLIKSLRHGNLAQIEILKEKLISIKGKNSSN